MKHSTERILTSHAGALPRTKELLDLFKAEAPAAILEPALKAAVKDVVAKQAEAGIDVVNDGEYGRPMREEVDYGAWITYSYDRLGGFEMRPLRAETAMSLFSKSRDFTDFAQFYAEEQIMASAGGEHQRFQINTGPITYIGQDAVKRDIANLKAALQGANVAEAFMSALATGIEFIPGSYYKSWDEQAAAVAAAMSEEYKLIIDAGLCVQLDDPIIVNQFELNHSLDWDIAGYRKWAERHVEAVNAALANIPEDKVRYHVCWGSWKGPHSADLPLKDVVDIMLKVKASQYSIEAANAQHEHEWKVWQEVKLPPGRMVMPGVVTHKTNILEHPELVADRIVRYAQILGRENVIAGTDCGLGGRMHPQLAWAKLRTMKQGADLATKRLWGR